MLAQAGIFLKGIIKVVKNAGIRAGNQQMGAPGGSLAAEAVCVWTDDLVDGLWRWLADNCRREPDRRAAVEEFRSMPAGAVVQAVAAEAPELSANEREAVLALAGAARHSLEACSRPGPQAARPLGIESGVAAADRADRADRADGAGQAVLLPQVRVESREDLRSLLTTVPMRRGPEGLHVGDAAAGRGTAGALNPGDLLAGRYRVVRMLGEGGMGVVALADDDELGGQVALKSIRPGSSHDAGLLDRLKTEVRLARKLSHEHIIRVHDIVRDPIRGLYCVTMDYMQGRTLAHWLRARAGGASVDEFCRIAAAVFAALRHAHARDVLHNDIKPSNIMVVDDLSDIRVLDFGLARAIGGGMSLVAPTGMTFYYVAPEVRDGGKQTVQSDIYSLGVLCYQLLTGRLPAAGSQPVARRRADVPAETSAAIARAMEEEATDRFDTVASFGAALWPAAGGGATHVVTRAVAAATTQEHLPRNRVDTVHEPLVLECGDNVKMQLVRIPAGEFMMGSPTGDTSRQPYERPQHRVVIARPFCMGKFPVTQREWRAVMGDAPSEFKGDDRPVETVSWLQAKEFCDALSEKLGKEVRLPSEAEWEYACRAGTKTAWSFGDAEGRLHDYAWYKKNSGGETHPVGKRKPNPWGLHDMHGNVWEWCEDVWQDDYTGAPTDGSAWLDGGDQDARLLRGGSYHFIGVNCRSAYRGKYAPRYRLYLIGFRVVVAAGTP